MQNPQRTWRLHVALIAAWSMALLLVLGAMLSIYIVGGSIINLCALCLGVAQVFTIRLGKSVAYKLTAIEWLSAGLLLMPFLFAPQDYPAVTAFPLWIRLTFFALGLVLSTGLAGLSLERATTISGAIRIEE